jgi:hypothetical protein
MWQRLTALVDARLRVLSSRYLRWASARDQAARERAEAAYMEDLANSCEELPAADPGQPSILITDCRITDLLNQLGADRAEQVIAAGRNPADIKLLRRPSWERSGAGGS